MKRDNRLTNREVRHVMQGETARKAIGTLSKDLDLFFLTKGDFSAINVLEEVLKQTGSADVIISTFSMGVFEIQQIERLIKEKLINKYRLIIDKSYFTRKPQFLDKLKKALGDTISVTKNHSKFFLICNKEWNIVILTSMNLNENKSIEFFEIINDKELFEYLSLFVKEITGDSYSPLEFKALGYGEQFEKYRPNPTTQNNTEVEQDDEDIEWLL